MRRFWCRETAFFLGLWLALLATGRSRLFQDPGTFWHTVVGRQVLFDHSLPRSDTFSFTCHGRPWIAHQWLGESAMAALYDRLGLDGLLLATATLLAGLFTWLAHRWLRAGAAVWPTSLAVALALAAGSHHFHVRPHLATIVLLPLTFALLVDVEAGRVGLRRLWWLVPLFVLWANVHGGVLAGVATLVLTCGGWGLARLAGRESPLRGRRQFAEVAAILAACTLALAASPYGLAMPRTWLAIMGQDLPDLIEEHAPLSLARPEGWMTLLVGAVYAGGLFATWPRRPDREVNNDRDRPAAPRRLYVRIVWLVPLVWLCLACERVRHAPLFALVACVALADLVPHSRLAVWLTRRGWWRLAGETSLPPSGINWRPAVVPAVLILSAVLFQGAGVSAPLVGQGWARLDPTLWPVDLLPEIERAQAADPAGTRVLNSLDLGGFLIFYAPRWQVFSDDRCELFGGDFLKAYCQAEGSNPAQLDRWADQYSCRLALVRAGSPFERHLAASHSWRLLRGGQAAALYERDGEAALPPSAKHPLGKMDTGEVHRSDP